MSKNRYFSIKHNFKTSEFLSQFSVIVFVSFNIFFPLYYLLNYLQNTKKYISLTLVSKTTASRDIRIYWVWMY